MRWRKLQQPPCEPEDGNHVLWIQQIQMEQKVLIMSWSLHMNHGSPPTFRLLLGKRIQLQIVKASILRFILTDQLCNSTLFSFLWAKKKCWSFLKMYFSYLGLRICTYWKNVHLGIGTLICHCCCSFPWNQSHASVVESVKQRLSIKEEWAALRSRGPHKEREALARCTVACVLGDK